MASLRQGWRIQQRVIIALMSRELTTRFGRENIGFLWIMAEPLLFAVLVSLAWTFMKGPEEHGVAIVAFVVSGYLPLTFLRHSFGRCTNIFVANGSLMYHRQIRILDFVFVRVLIETIGGMMAYLFIGVILMYFGYFPVPASIGLLVSGWALYTLFVLSMCFIIAPLSEVSEVLEKILPVTIYISIPFSGTFNMESWLSPQARDILLWSPMVNSIEMMRYGLFGDAVRPYYTIWVPIGASLICMTIGLALCRRVRRTLVVE
ncbi:ABC transporter permease [Sphingomonas bacterium]|uniref:ABC transporter permease n=1 Tax=Sphingomonas bacterium TaxID=1895847 RepID=UPI001574F7CD|nr:ABC transporter permease [Sphingomonas bacterium]